MGQHQPPASPADTPRLGPAIAQPAAAKGLAERVLQFGSGRFLRGFFNAMLDTAHRAGAYDGSAVIVQSTGRGRSNALAEQHGLFTLRVEGRAHGEIVRNDHVVSSIARAVTADTGWQHVLDAARAPDLELIVSNTTEVGIRLDPDDDPRSAPPRSFPAKLLAVLAERCDAFNADADRAPVILPCELIDRNGPLLREIVLELAERHGLPATTRSWIEHACVFCSTLVDRIVTAPEGDTLRDHEQRLGYRDDLLVVAEPYRLLAIEVPPAARDGAAAARVSRALRWTHADDAVVVTHDASPYRERKLRLLNGGHTFTVPASFLAGRNTVLEMMEHPITGAFVRRVLLAHIVPSLELAGVADADRFAADVLDRFANPFLRHRLLDITLQCSSKMAARNNATLRRIADLRGSTPATIHAAIAGWLLFLRPGADQSGTSTPRRDAGDTYNVTDDHAPAIAALWHESPDDPGRIARRALSIADIWGDPPVGIAGLAEGAGRSLALMINSGVEAALTDALERDDAGA